MTEKSLQEVADRIQYSADADRKLFAWVAFIICSFVLCCTILLNMGVKRIANLLQTTPKDVREAVEKLVESEAAESEAFARTTIYFDAIESSEDCFVQIDRDGRISRWSLGAERFFGYPRQAILGSHVSVLMTPDAMKQHAKKYPLAISERRQHEYGRKLIVFGTAVCADGSEKTVRLQIWIASQIGAIARITEVKE